MSGGSLEYVCYKVDDAVSTMRDHRGFYRKDEVLQHLDNVSKALHDIEWLLSCDYGESQVVDSINAMLRIR